MDQLLVRARREAGLSARELADRAGTSHSTILAYEQGRKVPRADTRERIIRAAGFVPASSLIRRRRVTSSGSTPGEELRAVIDLAGHFPAHHTADLEAPVFPPRRGPR